MYPYAGVEEAESEWERFGDASASPSAWASLVVVYLP
jgi:hypothetical protein